MIIGKGGYGTIYHPPRNDTLISQQYRNNPKYIQRYTDQSLQEINRGEKARRIFDPDNVMSSPILKIYPRSDKFVSQILPFRQKRISQDLFQKRTERGNSMIYWKIMRKMVGILRGLVRLHAHKMVHRDIKIMNLVYDLHPFQLYLIDWGTAVPFSLVYDKTNKHWWVSSIQNLPPEYKMYAREKNIYEYRDIRQDFGKNKVIPLLEKFDRDYQNKLQKADLEMNEKLKNPSDKFMNDIIPKVDIYALGIVFAQMTHKLKPELNESLKKQLDLLISNMIHPDPIERWDAKQSLHQLKKILK